MQKLAVRKRLFLLVLYSFLTIDGLSDTPRLHLPQGVQLIAAENPTSNRPRGSDPAPIERTPFALKPEKHSKVAESMETRRFCGICNVTPESDLAEAGSALKGSPAASQSNNIGPKRVLIIRADFADAPGAMVSQADALSRVQEVSAFLRANSFQQMWFEVIHVTPLLRMSATASYYASNSLPEDLLADARDAATQAGFPEEDYDFDILSIPYIGFPWVGLAFLGIKGILIQDQAFNHYALSHEFGHTFGSRHANAWSADEDVIVGPGANEEYGNSFDPLGSSSLFPFGHYNANAKYLAGWLNDQKVHTVSNSGLYRLWAQDSGATLQPTQHYAARIPAPFSIGGVSQDYWLDYRQQLVANPWLVNGVVLKAANDFASAFGTRLLDTSPFSPGWFVDAPLLIGRTYSDLTHGIFITPVGRGTNASLPFIDIQINIAPVASRAPAVTLQGSAVAVEIGETVQFSTHASDPDGDALAYGWDFGDNTVLPASLNRPHAAKSWNAHGEFVVRSIVSDMKGGLASDSVLVRVGNPLGRRVSGQVLLGSRPLEGVRIQAYGPAERSAYTGSQGKYILTGLTPGAYDIQGIKSGYTITNEISQPIHIESNDIVMNWQAAPKSRPFVSGFTPATGSVSTVASISGANFSGVRNVAFNQTPASFTISSISEISAIVPEGAISGPIALSGVTGSDYSQDEFIVTPSYPTITLQPQSQCVYIGSNVTFSVKTLGSGPMARQWTHDGLDIPGATNSIYQIFGVRSNQAGIYAVRVTNLLGTDVSASAILTVVPPVTFAEALETPDLVWTTSGTLPWLTQTNVTHDGTDAAQAGGLRSDEHSRLETTVLGPGRISFWWRISSGFPGTHYLLFHIGAVERDYIGGERNWASVSFFVPPGPQVLSWTYQQQSSSPPGGQNKAWLDQVAFVHIDGDPPVITQQPRSQTVEADESALFTVTATGTAPLCYQWRNEYGDIEGETNASLFIPNVTFRRGNLYAVTVSNILDSVTSAWAGLTITPRVRPTVLLSSSRGDFLEQPPIVLQATPFDPDGTVTLVEFFHETNLLGQAAVPPFTLIWSNRTRGSYTFTARATDNHGQMATSAPVIVSITALIPRGSVWKYLDRGISPDNSWPDLHFDDSSWSWGAAELGYGNSPVTEIGFGADPTNKHISAWFRHVFAVAAPLPSSNLTLRVKRDDGAIVYLNGSEVFRNNLPVGPVDHLTPALRPTEGPEEEQFVTVGLDPALIVEGTNVVAVEIHQSDPGSPDLTFDLALVGDLPWEPPRIWFVSPVADQSLFGPKIVLRPAFEDHDGHVSLVEFFVNDLKIGQTAILPFSFLWTNAPAGYYYFHATATDNTGQTANSDSIGVEVSDSLVSFGAQWRYLDDGSVLPLSWHSSDFDDSSWLSGQAEFGYGYQSPATTIGFGGDPQNKHIASYFRHAFDVSEPSDVFSATIRLRRGDGALVYLNGTELFRDNLPAGEITSRTLALKPIEGFAEEAFVQRGIAPALLRRGRNVLAVEMHQDSPASPDLRFDLALGVNLSPAWPYLEITSPASYGLAEGPSVVLEAAASDRDGHVAVVEWFAEETKIGESTGPPFIFNWSNVPPCSFVISANAIDNEGFVASASVPLQVVSPQRFKTLVPRLWTVWRYRDRGVDPGSAWRHPGFYDQDWQYGHSSLGFGDTDFGEYETQISPTVTAYFRHHFRVTELANYTNLVVLFEPTFGEGAVVYLNGAELYRARVPPGEISSSTHAGDFGVTSNANAIAALRAGTNLLAVEFHQPFPMPDWSAFSLELKVGRTGDLSELTPCFHLYNLDALAFITWGDPDKWFLEVADDPSGPWSHYSDASPAVHAFYLAQQKFFRLRHR